MREGGGFTLKTDDGRLLRLELARTPVDLVEKRVRIVGRLYDEAMLEADGVQPA
ncbi:DUF5818 domain-containing protein [Rhizorhabdus sp. FW153]|uniref:DUF5818 domain-containing protein n=1 Tax=Rhizorhabdus sp. FW153 TaxID=3400216 RepID=UPI003CF211D9